MSKLRADVIAEIQKVTGLDETTAKMMYWVVRLGKDEGFAWSDIREVFDLSDADAEADAEDKLCDLFESNPMKMWKITEYGDYECTKKAKKLVLGCVKTIVDIRDGANK